MYLLAKSHNAFIIINPIYNLNKKNNLNFPAVKLKLQKLDRNTKITLGVSLYSYLLNHYESINFPIVVIYAFILYYLSLYLIYQLK